MSTEKVKSETGKVLDRVATLAAGGRTEEAVTLSCAVFDTLTELTTVALASKEDAVARALAAGVKAPKLAEMLGVSRGYIYSMQKASAGRAGA